MKAQFVAHLDDETIRMNEHSNNIANELAIYDDLMMAGEHLANKAHDMEVMRRYMGLKTQLEEKIVDEEYEDDNIFLRNAYLFEGLLTQ